MDCDVRYTNSIRVLFVAEQLCGILIKDVVHFAVSSRRNVILVALRAPSICKLVKKNRDRVALREPKYELWAKSPNTRLDKCAGVTRESLTTQVSSTSWQWFRTLPQLDEFRSPTAA